MQLSFEAGLSWVRLKAELHAPDKLKFELQTPIP